ncbi:NfeD family protein [Alloalcanivorax profundimaris]|uniref:NfeD family protein n=1 Tax=Alloalcanivorax profundimaris TaxID=2735259 RepID=UPI00188887C4|nr:nodulation protein NfeD [Alloalcanivorax profundimaris]MBF1801336.1 nodulation protein NfeD [Alloalcanivorax profundimaris]MCQ6263087.1 nodulation protein NfeD [Alcanivorax sp. MM125-6]
MRRWQDGTRRLALMALLLGALAPAFATAAPTVRVLDLKGAIGPAVSDGFVRALARANEDRVALFVLRLDTPGGLDAAMRDMIHAILDSRVPVAVYVAPSGSRAASAGTYLLYAAHVAAMAPATNLGAATPVQIGGDSPLPGGAEPPDSDPEASSDAPPDSGSALRHKQINDAVAYIRALAELRGRNADWAEQAVRQAQSLPAGEALERNVIDLMATDLDDLLTRLDGRQISVDGDTVTLELAGATVETVEQDWRTAFLAVITDPSIAYILMLVGLYGLVLEFSSPGVGAPGVLGAICLLLALYALQMLPVSYVGLGLIVLGVGLMVAEALSPSFGVLGAGGLAALLFGSVMLMDTDLPAFQIALPVIAAVGAGGALLLGVAVRLAVKAHRHPVVSGADTLIGARAVALEDFQEQGQVRAAGEVWRARAARPVRRGQALLVRGRDGLTLDVEEDSP